MARPFGSKAYKNGKLVLWAGENYGYQSPQSYKALEKAGKFRTGAQALDRLGSSVTGLLRQYVPPQAQAAWAELQKRQAAELEKLSKTGQSISQALNSTPGSKRYFQQVGSYASVPLTANSVITEDISKLTNVDNRIVGTTLGVAAGALTGGTPAVRLPAIAPVTRQAAGRGASRGLQRQLQEASRRSALRSAGAIHPTGHPRAGTVKLRPKRDIPVPHDDIEAAVEKAYQHHNKTGSLHGYDKHVANLPDNQQVVIYNRGNVDFPTRNGLTTKVIAGQQTAPAPSRSATPSLRTSPWADTPELNAQRQAIIDAGLPDPNTRYHTKITPEGNVLTRDQKELLATAAPDKATLNQHLKEFDTSKGAPATVKGVTYTPNSDKIRVVPLTDKQITITDAAGKTKVHTIPGAKTIQAEVQQIPGYEGVRIDSYQAHHQALLKESADFMSYFDDATPIHNSYGLNKVFGGTQALNRTDLPVRLHQGDLTVKGDNGRVYRGYMNRAAHERLQAKPGTPEAGFPIQAEQGTSRWSFLADLPSDKERLKYLEFHINDLKKAQRIAQESYFNQYLIDPADAKYGVDPYIGNFSQQVLAPHDKIAPILEQDYKNKRRRTLQVNGT